MPFSKRMWNEKLIVAGVAAGMTLGFGTLGLSQAVTSRLGIGAAIAGPVVTFGSVLLAEVLLEMFPVN